MWCCLQFGGSDSEAEDEDDEDEGEKEDEEGSLFHFTFQGEEGAAWGVAEGAAEALRTLVRPKALTDIESPEEVESHDGEKG